MPLVLAAIDLKLSPSSSAIKKREKRLNSLGLIIKHSESVYDVTDIVAVGTNHILQLAYTTTQSLFFDRAATETPFDGTHAEQPVSGTPSQNSRSSPVMSTRTRRPESWQEAFIRCPRAYLLISKSVDYSLAVGRLPSAHDLPDIVRDLPALGNIPRLPWTSVIPPHLHTVNCQSPHGDGMTPSDSSQEDSKETQENAARRLTLPPIPDLIPAAPVLPLKNQPKHLNLDYMDLSKLEDYASTEQITNLSVSSSPSSFEGGIDGLPKETTLKTYEMPVAYSARVLDSNIFKSFYHEAFEQRWLSHQSDLL